MYQKYMRQCIKINRVRIILFVKYRLNFMLNLIMKTTFDIKNKDKVKALAAVRDSCG